MSQGMAHFLVQRYFFPLPLSLCHFLLFKRKTSRLILYFILWTSFPTNQLQLLCPRRVMRNEDLILKFLDCLIYLLFQSYCLFIWPRLCQSRKQKLRIFGFGLFSQRRTCHIYCFWVLFRIHSFLHSRLVHSRKLYVHFGVSNQSDAKFLQ